MPDKFDLYNYAYRGDQSEVYQKIRLPTYGRDFGQTSWVTSEESDKVTPRIASNAAFEHLKILPH